MTTNDYKEFDSFVLEERIKAIIRLLLPLLATAAGYLGLTFDVELVWSLACAIIGAVSTIVAWWYNNNMTKLAAKSQQEFNAEKKIEKGAKHAIND